MVYKIKNIY